MSTRSSAVSSAAPDATPRKRLRAATAAAHERVDRGFARFDLADAAAYAGFLAAHADAFLPVEAALDAVGAERLLADWPERRRADALRCDLAALGRPAAPGARFAIDDDAAAWGALYVLEGSRLGGAMLARSVPDGMPVRYLAAPQPPGAWRTMLARLDLALDQDARCAAAIDAAGRVFARFEAAAAQTGETAR